MADGSHGFMQISISRREKVYHVIAVWSCDQCSDHVTLNTEFPRIPHPLLWGRHKWIRGPTRARGAICKYLTNDDLSRHCGTGERQKYDDLSRHSGTQVARFIVLSLRDPSRRLCYWTGWDPKELVRAALSTDSFFEVWEVFTPGVNI